MKIQLLALITHQVRLAIEDRYIKSYHPFSAPHAEVYVDRIQKNSRYPWLLDVEGTAQMEDVGYGWDTHFDIYTEEWSPIRYFFGGNIHSMDVER